MSIRPRLLIENRRPLLILAAFTAFIFLLRETQAQTLDNACYIPCMQQLYSPDDYDWHDRDCRNRCTISTPSSNREADTIPGAAPAAAGGAPTGEGGLSPEERAQARQQEEREAEERRRAERDTAGTPTPTTNCPDPDLIAQAEASAAAARQAVNRIRDLAYSNSNNSTIQAALRDGEAAAVRADQALNNIHRATCGQDRTLASQAVAAKDEADGALARAEGVANTSSDIEGRIADLEHKYENQCKQAVLDARKCCEQPESCLTEALGDAEGEVGSVAVQALQLAAGMALNIPASGIAAMCGRMQTVSQGFTVINGALAFKCHQKVGACDRACEGIEKEITDLRAECRRTGSCGPEETRKFTQISDSAGMCKRLNNASSQRALQAVASAQASKLSGMCKNLAGNIPTAEELQKAQFDADCSNPANAANPLCQNQCNRPGAVDDPKCRELFGLTDPNNSRFGQDALDRFLAAQGKYDEEWESPQLINDMPIAPTSSSLAQGQGGGAGVGGGLGGGGGGGFDQSSGAGGGYDDGYNTKIDRGLASGTGYTNPPVRTGTAGGWRGYAAGGGGQPAGKKGRPFSLKDFLPGGKGPGARKVAGVAGALPIAPSHADIFKQINKGFIRICEKDGLYDCNTLKNHRPGN